MPTVHLFVDASLQGWDAQDQTVPEVWSDVQCTLDINNLELESLIMAISHYDHISFGQANIDLFAMHQNYQLRTYISLIPGP